MRKEPEIADDGYRDPIAELDHPKQRAVLRVYQQCCNVTKATRAAKVERSQHYYWLNNNPDYARAFESAKREAGDLLESELMDRVLNGVPKVLYHAGKPVLDDNGEPVIEYTKDAATLIFALKAAFPEKYRDNYSAPHEEGDGVRITGRARAEVIREEIEARQKCLEMILESEKRRQ